MCDDNDKIYASTASRNCPAFRVSPAGISAVTATFVAQVGLICELIY